MFQTVLYKALGKNIHLNRRIDGHPPGQRGLCWKLGGFDRLKNRYLSLLRYAPRWYSVRD